MFGRNKTENQSQAAKRLFELFDQINERHGFILKEFRIEEGRTYDDSQNEWIIKLELKTKKRPFKGGVGKHE